MALRTELIQRIIAEEGPTVYRLAMAQTRNSADADDIYQDVFLRYLKNEPVFQSAQHQRAWFIRVTVNCCKDLFKRAHRNDLPLDHARNAMKVSEEHAELAAALEALEPNQRAMVHLYYFEGYKTDEIAALMNMKPATVRSGLDRARQKLKKLMEGGVARV